MCDFIDACVGFNRDCMYCITQYPVLMKLHVSALFDTRYQKMYLVVNRILCYTINTGLLKMIVGVLTTCHTQYIEDRSIRIFFI